MSQTKILISILNWNKADVTLACLAALREIKNRVNSADILLIDNGSTLSEYEKLRQQVDPSWVELLRLEKNLGFTGGHNVSIKIAIEKQYDYVWLLNNDAIVQADVLDKLLAEMSANERCGAVSPVIYAEEDTGHLNGWGATHDWRARDTQWLPSAAASLRLHETHPERVCLAGTAVMFRVAALRETGLLDDRLFAYFDDNDIGTRLAHHGWFCRVAFDAKILHESREFAKQPQYFFYLMFRNELIFWHTHMPKQFRKLLWLKLINQSVFNVSRLRQRGMQSQADAALLGTWDFIRKKYGAPDLKRRAPVLLRVLERMLARLHKKQLSGTAVLPTSAIETE